MPMITNTNDLSLTLSLNILKALGGDTSKQYDSVEEVWVAIDEIYGRAGDGIDIEAIILNITENGQYNFDPTDQIDAYAPVHLTVEVPQKYTDEQVESLKDTARQEGYNDGFIDGEADGYNDGYAEGLDEGFEDGVIDQKSKLEDATFTANGTYTKEDGWDNVTVAVEIPDIPSFETQVKDVTITSNGDVNVVPDDGFDAMSEVNISVEVPLPTFETETLSVNLTENGNYNYTPTKDGYSSVEVTVDVASSGGGSGVDLTTIGYSADVNDAYNANMTNGVAYAQSIMEEFNGTTSASGNSKYKDNTNLVYFPIIDTKFNDMQYMFQNCNNLQMVDIKNNGSTRYAQMRYCFDGCTDVKSIKISHSIADPTSAFRNCCNLTNIEITQSGGNLYHEDATGDYGYFSYAFENCFNLETFPPCFFNGYRGLYLNGMFKNCKKMTVAPTISYGNYYTKQNQMSEMFMGCESLLKVPYMQRAMYCPDWRSTFEGCTSLVDAAMTYNIGPDSSILGNIQLDRCFYGCTNLTIAPVRGGIGRNTTTNYMYYKCSNLTTPFTWYVTVISASNMYYQCSKLTYMTSTKMDLTNCADVTYMFGYCSALTNIGENGSGTVVGLGAVENLVGTTNMFFACNALSHTALVSIIDGLYDRATAGYPVLTLTLGSINLAKLSEDEIAIATNKGWTIA